MNVDSVTNIVPGDRIPVQDLVPTPNPSPPPLGVDNSGTLADLLLTLNKDLALLLLAAGCFFLGVILACITPGRDNTFRRETAVSAPFTFLLTAGLWFPLLNGNIVVTSIAPIDSILKFFIDGGISGQMFTFGLVMVLGYHSAAVFDFINRFFRGLIQYLAARGPKPPADPPAAPN